MGWVAPIVDDETISTALNRADVDSVVAEQIEKFELEVCIPETIPEEENESRDNSMVDAVETLECKDSSGPPQPSLTTRVIRQLSSSDAYSGLEPGEDGDNFRAQDASSQLSRKSRFSRLFGSTKEPSEGSSSSKTRKVTSGFFGNFTSDSNKSILDDSDAMKERFPGFKYRSNSQILTNETNLSIIDEMDDIPPQQVAPGRYTTLKQIIGTMDSNSNSNLSEAGDIKGIKGTKIEPLVSGGITQATASARARERLPDGLGAIIGGVLFEKLIVKKVEFTPRYLELKLVDIMPLPINKSEQYLKPLNANKITPFRELISGTNNLSYDRHLILDGVDFSREKHIEILIRVLDLPIEKSVEMLKDWVSKSIEQATSDIPDHWEDFITNNSTVFSQKIRELKEQITDNRSSPPLLSIDSSYPRDSSRSNNSNSKNSQHSDEDSFIQHLDLRYCQITNRGISLLVHSLRANEKLKTLNLTGNMINRDSAAASLGNMLNFNSSLLEINLQETNLGDTGATLVAQALHINLVS